MTDYNGNSLTFGAEDRLTAAFSVFAATYDGDGMRATTTESGTTTYYLYSGDVPVIEETYNGTIATISAVNVWGADGWRARYYPGTPEFYGFNFDPEGNVTNQQDSINTLNPGFCTTFYEAYGHLGNTWLFNAHTQASNYSPAGFGAQWGYYTDTYSILMGHRYYGLKTGRFLNRDPSGYNGGINLYAYADQNPVNEDDPSGLDGTGPDWSNAHDDGDDYFSNHATSNAKGNSTYEGINGPHAQGMIQTEKQAVQQTASTALNLVPVVGEDVAAARSIEELSHLQAIANRIQDALPWYAKIKRTTAVIKLNDGTIVVASSTKYLTKAQQAIVNQIGAVYARGSGHAEITAVEYARYMGYNVEGVVVAASRRICGACSSYLQEYGAVFSTQTK